VTRGTHTHTMSKVLKSASSPEKRSAGKKSPIALVYFCVSFVCFLPPPLWKGMASATPGRRSLNNTDRGERERVKVSSNQGVKSSKLRCIVYPGEDSAGVAEVAGRSFFFFPCWILGADVRLHDGNRRPEPPGWWGVFVTPPPLLLPPLGHRCPHGAVAVSVAQLCAHACFGCPAAPLRSLDLRFCVCTLRSAHHHHTTRLPARLH
jgi:hypothetical protein